MPNTLYILVLETGSCPSDAEYFLKGVFSSEEKCESYIKENPETSGSLVDRTYKITPVVIDAPIQGE